MGSDSDEEWFPGKARQVRKSVAPKAKRKSTAPKVTVSLYSDKTKSGEAKENLQPPRASTLKPDSSLENTESNIVTAKTKSSRRSVAPKTMPTNQTVSSDPSFEKESTVQRPPRQFVFQKPSSTVNSVEPKDNKIAQQVKNADTNLDEYDFKNFNQGSDDKTKAASVKGRKSIATKVVSNVSQAQMKSNGKSNLQRRNSVTFKVMPTPLQSDREKFEEEINSYCGEDPLSVWYKYFKWEQNFSKGGKDDQFVVSLMQRCLRALDRRKEYNSDKRFLEIWLKFASVSPNPVRVYNHMFNHKIGCMFAKLFTEWASVVESEGNLTLAEEVLKKGVDCQAEPIHELKSYWSKLKARNSTDSKEPKMPPPLKKSAEVPKTQSKPDVAASNIFADKDANSKPDSMTQSCDLPSDPSQYYRQSSCYFNTRMSVLPRESNLTRAGHEPEDPPLVIFEPPDPMKIPMYDKDKVYSSNGEMSFEEIRAAAWFKLESTRKQEQRLTELEAKVAEQAELIKKFKEENGSLKRALFFQKNQAKNSTCDRSQQTDVPQTSDRSTSPVEVDQSWSSRRKSPILEEPKKTEPGKQVKPRKNRASLAHFPRPAPVRLNSETSSNALTTVDPFDEDHKNTFLQSLSLPNDYYGNLCSSKERIGELHKLDIINVGEKSYVIEDLIAQGSYGKVYAAVEKCSSSGTSKSKVALKVTKNASNWEIYACATLHQRLKDLNSSPVVFSSAMKVTSSHKYANAIIFTNELSKKGTLLDLVNNYKIQKTNVPELLAMYITWEMLELVSKMHQCQIIHADIKPDNVLIRDNITIQDIKDSLPLKTVLVKLIDFGRVIDLTAYEKGVSFTTSFKKDKCIEMIEKKPWVFQIDWFGLLNCVHVLLFADYIKVKKQADGRWFIEKKLKRHWDHSIWLPLFDELLNIPSCYQQPNVEAHCNRIISKLQQNIKDFKF